MMGKVGKNSVSIPISHIDTPRFRYGDKQQGGVGQGKGKPGDPMGDPGDGEEGEGNEAGNEEGEHTLDVEVTIDELAEILGEELQLPDITNKGKKSVETDAHKYTGIKRIGPESLKNFKRTYKEALKRNISLGNYQPGQLIIPIKEDKRYKAAAVKQDEAASLAIIHMMDASGSMGVDQKTIARSLVFWTNAWLRKQYGKKVSFTYIIHDTVAQEVDENSFFTISESGGTNISSAYKMCADVIEKKYPPSEWNIYAFHISDGDNYGTDDNELSCEILKERIIPSVNLFGYGQVDSAYGSGQFLPTISRFGVDGENKVIAHRIENADAILGCIKHFFGGGM